jgi:hypothetical protein
MRYLRSCSLAAVAAVTTMTIGCGGDDERTPTAPAEPTLAEIRAANAQFQDVAAARAAGFAADPSGMCVSAAMVGAPAALGAMGIHYSSAARLGVTAFAPRLDGNDGVVDFLKPETLVYEPQGGGGGTLRLVALEYVVFEAAWKAAGHTRPPTFQGKEFVYVADNPATPQDEAHGFAPHYNLHVWAFRDNASGLTADFNPAVRCP